MGNTAAIENIEKRGNFGQNLKKGVNSERIEAYLKLGGIWQELKWLFYGGENGFQGNRGNGKLLKRCQNRGLDRSNSGNIGNYLKMCKREILQNIWLAF